MHWIDSFNDLRLDIVGIIAVLGEASITRNAQVTSLSWWSTLPRLMPAPHALLEHERKYRLPTAPGIVAGAYSGTVKKEINFFAQLLHPEPLEDFQVELVQVTRKVTGKAKRSRSSSSGNEAIPETKEPRLFGRRQRAPAIPKQPRSFGPRKYGPLFWVSLGASGMSLALIGLSVHYHDGFSLLSTIMLSLVSSFVGFGTHWSLVFKEPTVSDERQGAIPRSDVIIYYPNGSIRVVRPESEQIARLYFQTEHAQYVIDDTPYRTLALFSTVMFMAGVVSLANALNILQVAFAASYILLNIVHWAVSALNPCTYHWQHAYDVEVLPIAPPQKQGTDGVSAPARVQYVKEKIMNEWRRFESAWVLEKRRHRARERAKTIFVHGGRNFTAALWTAIVLTGTAQWLNEATTIAPINEAWKEWLREADQFAQPKVEEGETPGRHNDEWENRYELHARPRISTGLKGTFTPALKASRRSAARQRRIKIDKSWKYQDRLTEILAAHAPQTRIQLDDEVAGATDSVATFEKDPLTPATTEEV